jgi:transcriptional regulator with GAF, ATPase, and Fis domain
MVEHAYPPELVDSIGVLAGLVIENEDVASTVRVIAELAGEAIEGADHCSISMVRDGKIKTVASLTDAGYALDEIQYATHEGPCISSIRKRGTFHIPDMDADETWPKFSKRASKETGIKSLMGFVLEVGPDSLGAINMMSDTAGAFEDDDVAIGAFFAGPAAVALSNALAHEHDRQHIKNLEQGMVTRQMIGQAVGIIMAARHVTSDEAFAQLKRISQKTNVKLRDIAADVISKSDEIPK